MYEKAIRASTPIVFFIALLLSESGLGQRGFFSYDTTLIVPIETSKIFVNPSLPIALTIDEQNQIAYAFLSIDHDKKTIFYLSINLSTYVPKIHEIGYTKRTKIDKRTTRGRMILLPENKNKLVGIKLFDLMLVVNPEEDVIESVVKVNKEDEYFFVYENYSIGAEYYNDFLDPVKTRIEIIEGTQTKFKIHPKQDFIEFTHFTPCHLVACSNQYIAWLSVSKPYMLLYNHQLQLSDSIRFYTNNWSDIDSLKKLDFYKDLRERGLFEFGSAAIEKEAGKNWSVQFINDSLLLITSTVGIDNTIETILQISPTGKLQIINQHNYNTQVPLLKDCTEENFEIYLQSANGKISNNKLYYLGVGSGNMPWQDSRNDIDYSIYTYLNFHLFEYREK